VGTPALQKQPPHFINKQTLSMTMTLTSIVNLLWRISTSSIRHGRFSRATESFLFWRQVFYAFCLFWCPITKI